jgi:hypothetical protein
MNAFRFTYGQMLQSQVLVNSLIFSTLFHMRKVQVYLKCSIFGVERKISEKLLFLTKKNPYSNTKTENLSYSFKETFNIDIAPVMESWLKLA